MWRSAQHEYRSPALHASQGLAHLLLQAAADASRISPEFPCHLQQEQLSLWLWGLRFCKPKGSASGSQTLSMWLPSVVFVDSANYGMASRCLYLSTPKGQPLHSPFVLTLLLQSPYLFLSCWSPENSSYNYHVF